MQLKNGDIFAEHYQLKKLLGVGSFGEVWLARNILADVDVAIKLYGLLDDNGIKDFREEFKLAYKLHHPNLLHLNHFDVFGQCPFLVMPYCPKGSSASLKGKMSEKQIWRFIRDVSCGLMFLHNQNPPIIHQDIKPDNILIGDDDKFIISDFDISRKLEHTFRKSINKVESSGTLAYMGPERFAEKPLIVATSDIWSLGMSVYELSTGLVLWEGMGGCVQLNGAHIPALDEKYSSQLSQFVHACLALNTWDRPTAQQAYEFACSILKQTKTDSPSVQLKPIAPLFPKTTSPRLKEKFCPSNMHKRIAGWTGLGIVLILLLVKGGSIYFRHLEEERKYAACRTEEDYRDFLKEYPSSSHANFIKQFLGNKVNPISPINREENIVMDSVKTDTAKLEQFQEEPKKQIVHPHPQSSSQPELPITDIREVRRENEERLFYSCQSVADYEEYLRKYPKGRFVHKAKRAIQQIESEMMQSNPSTQEIHIRKNTRVNVRL